MRGQNLFSRILAANMLLTRAASAFQPLLLLAVRLYWGWQFAQTGWGKVQHIPKVTDFFTSLGIPFPAVSAAGVSWLELIGGVLLFAGLGSRFTGLLLGADMLVAYLTAGRANLFSIISDPGKFYGDDAYTFLFASVLILVFGPGRYSIDHLLQKRYQTGADRDYVSAVQPSAATAR